LTRDVTSFFWLTLPRAAIDALIPFAEGHADLAAAGAVLGPIERRHRKLFIARNFVDGIPLGPRSREAQMSHDGERVYD